MITQGCADDFDSVLLQRKADAAYVAALVHAHQARSLALVRSQETHREVEAGAAARKAAKARYRAAMAAAQNARRAMLRDVAQYAAGEKVDRVDAHARWKGRFCRDRFSPANPQCDQVVP
jgi:hypothetical protein